MADAKIVIPPYRETLFPFGVPKGRGHLGHSYVYERKKSRFWTFFVHSEISCLSETESRVFSLEC